jgi:sugar phosphate isomerase/epimerase
MTVRVDKHIACEVFRALLPQLAEEIMARPVTLFTGQWADLSFESICQKAKSLGYDGLELACWGDHFDVGKALKDKSYCDSRHEILARHGLKTWAISNHLVGQAVCDNIDVRHKSILPAHVWGDGKPDRVRKRAAEEMLRTAHAATNLGVKVVNGFTGSSIWHLLYSFPPVSQQQIEDGFAQFAEAWNPILDEFKKCGVKFALEVHPTEIAFDIATAERAVKELNGRKEFGFNYDPSHLGYQGVNYVKFIRTFGDRIYHVHMKDAWWGHGDGTVGVFGGHTNFGDSRRYWDFRSLGHGDINFEEIIVALNDVGYGGPLSVEWEDIRMDREHGAKEACAFVRKLDFKPSGVAFDAAFEKK